MPENQRYPTCGDYIYDAEDDTLTIFVSRMDDWKSELAVAIHELFESVCCLGEGVEFKEIDLFDMKFEESRKPDDFSEPGDELNAPYHSQHLGATLVEKEVCHQTGITWFEHEKNVNEA